MRYKEKVIYYAEVSAMALVDICCIAFVIAFYALLTKLMLWMTGLEPSRGSFYPIMEAITFFGSLIWLS